MKETQVKWLVGVAAVFVIGAICIFGFMGVKKASEPEVDRTKPPQGFYDRPKGSHSQR